MPVREVLTNADREQFIRLPWSIYRDDPHWVPPLISERRAFLDARRNPFFEHAEAKLFLASGANGRVVGRIAAVVNRRHLEVHRDGAGFFGLFECGNDPGQAGELFRAAAEFLRAHGLTTVRGPENLSINDDVGLLIEGFDSPPAVMMPHNPHYYAALVEGHGFRKAMDLNAYCGDARHWDLPERAVRGVEVCRRRYKFSIRSLDMRRFHEEIGLIHAIYTQAWQQNWGAVAMTDREFEHLAKDMRSVVDPDLCLLAEVNGEPAGFSLALPDFNQALIHLDGRLFPFGILKLLWYRRKIDRIRIITTGVLPRFRHTGIDNAFYCETTRRAVAKGLYRGEMSWILETNAAMNNAMLNLGFRVYKKYRIYDLPLSPGPERTAAA
jgi:hypothetical protein